MNRGTIRLEITLDEARVLRNLLSGAALVNDKLAQILDKLVIKLAHKGIHEKGDTNADL
jgi:hypothetical protein